MRPGGLVAAAAAAVIAATLTIPQSSASADAGCRIVQEFTYDASTRTVSALNVFVCADPDRGHDNTVTIRKYNPYTGVTERVISGKGIVRYRCEGDAYRYFYGPGDRLDLYCS